MKILKIFLFVALVATVVSCKKDDDSNSESGIAGTWMLTSINGNGTITYDDGTTETTGTFVATTTRTTVVTIIAENPNLVTSNGSFDLEYTITYNGTSETETLVNEDLFGTEVWVQNGTALTLTEGGDSDVYTINSLTNTTLQLTTTETEVDTTSNPGVTETSTVTYVAVFARQ